MGSKNKLGGVFSPSGIRLANEIVNGEIDPLVTLRKGLEVGGLTVETVWICLQKYRELRLDRLSESARIEQIGVDRVGGLTLDWLWQDEARWVDVLSHQVLFFDTVCYYLVAEGLQDYIVGTIRLRAPASGRLPVPFRWRGIILRSLVKALLDTETQQSADRAIQLFIEIRDEVLDLRAQSENSYISGDDEDAYRKLSLNPACIELSSRLITNAYPNTSESQFRRFLRANWNVPKTGKSKEFSCAILLLYIPDAPEPDHALRLFRGWFGESHLTRDLHWLGNDAKYRKPVYFALCRLEDVLLGQERTDDALWVARMRDSLFKQSEQRNFHRTKRIQAEGGDLSTRKVGAVESDKVKRRTTHSSTSQARG